MIFSSSAHSASWCTSPGAAVQGSALASDWAGLTAMTSNFANNVLNIMTGGFRLA